MTPCPLAGTARELLRVYGTQEGMRSGLGRPKVEKRGLEKCFLTETQLGPLTNLLALAQEWSGPDRFQLFYNLIRGDYVPM